MRKRLLRALALAFIPLVGSLIIRLLYLSCRKKFHLPERIPEEPVILAFWHDNLLMQSYLYAKTRKKQHIKLLISDHFDGKLLAGVMRYFSLGTIHGSSRSNAAKVLIQAIRYLKEGYDIGITPDGPKGPRHEVADGVIVMAQKTKRPVVVYHCVPSAYWQLGSWDRFMIPKPFGTLTFYASEPIYLDGMEKEAARTLIKTKLMEHAL